MKKIVSLISLLVLAVASLVLAGCGSSNDNINKSVAISFANSSASWQRNGNTLKSLLEAEGFSVDLRFADTTDQQIDDIDKLLVHQYLNKQLGIQCMHRFQHRLRMRKNLLHTHKLLLVLVELAHSFLVLHKLVQL